ncbi:hypothetical protein ROT00_11980 [Agromyces mediolanus]|uniref:hypothetical protein n=1 Tax=Agromyces mediolanus TaxID=41986 RepID=UPI0038323646
MTGPERDRPAPSVDAECVAAAPAGTQAELLAARYGRTLRTPERPMAFTFGEFARGAGMAWLAFQLAYPVVFALVGTIGSIVAPATPDSVAQSIGLGLVSAFYAFLFQTPWTLGALLGGGVLAWLLGWAMQRVRALGLHLAAFATLGLAIGVVASWNATGAMGNGPSLLVVPAALVSAAAVAFGWRWTAVRALRADAPASVGLGHAR